MERRNEDTSEVEDDAHAPPYKRQRLSRDSTVQQHTETSYENTHTHGSARAHYGHVFNYMAPAQPQNLPAVLPPVFHDQPRSAESEAARWIGALRFDGMDLQLATMLSAHGRTCRWLPARKEYKIWRDPDQAYLHNGFLWIKGKPGTGKSTLMKAAYTRGLKVHVEDVTVSYFFSARDSLIHRSAEGMYRSLLCQLLGKFPQLSFALENLGLQLNQDCAIWCKGHLETLLREVVLCLPSKHLTSYVDAIDECKYTDAQDVVDFLQELHRAARESGVNVLVLISSRHFPQLSAEGCLQITLDDIKEHEADLSMYICAKLRLGESSKAQRIRKTIQQRASGIFLWVVLIIRILNEDKARGKVHLLEDHLDSLPEDLNHLFENLLQHDAGDKSVLLLTIQWLLFANRSLRLDELYFALTTNDSSGDIQDWDRDEVNVADMRNFVLNTSNGLVETTDETVPTVQFIHGTVRDYLINTWLPSQYAQPTAASAALCHERLWKCCRDYVLRSSPVLLPTPKHGVREHMSRCFRMATESRCRIKQSHPFLEYALHGLVMHANASQSLGNKQQAFIRDFPLDKWVRLHNILAVNPADRMSKNTSCEYIFVIKNALALVKVLINQESELMRAQCDIKGEKYQSLLGAAVANGYNGMVALLLEYDADPNSLVNGSFKCLDTAVMQGNTDIVHELLDHGADVQRSASDLQDTHLSPLHRAAESGHTDIVRALLSHPTYAAQWHPNMDCVLEAAIYRRDSGMIRLLYEKMCPARRAIAGAMYTANHLCDNKADQEVNMFKAIHSFRTYYQNRERGEPALLDTICRVFKDYASGSSQAFQPSHALSPRSVAAMIALNQVLIILNCQSSQLPTPMPTPTQAEHRLIVIEYVEGWFRNVHFDEDNYIANLFRVYEDNHVRDLIKSRIDRLDSHDDESSAIIYHPNILRSKRSGGIESFYDDQMLSEIVLNVVISMLQDRNLLYKRPGEGPKDEGRRTRSMMRS